MKTISSKTFIEQYDEISDYCKKTGEPVCITNNGCPDLIAMSKDYFQKQEGMLNNKKRIISEIVR